MAKRKTTKAAPRVEAPQAARVVYLRAKYDAAQTTDDNRRHWTNADAASADASANPMIRRTLRNRARYEVANDCYASGVVNTIANDTVGTGPKLQIIGKSKALAARIEAAFSAHCKAINLPLKLRQMRAGRIVSGEAFAVLFNNPRLSGPSQLDVRIIEPDHVMATTLNGSNEGYYDGIQYDEYGNPVAYDILRAHPGETGVFIASPGEYDTIPAAFVWHYYKAERPGQRRGVPEITPALPLFANRRRFSLATVASAETAANHAGVMYSDAPPTDAPSTVTPYDLVELERNSAVVLPQGWKLTQLDPSQPTTNYPDYNNALLRELGRCLDTPYTIIALDSSESNMSAAYMDQHAYAKARVIDRSDLGGMVSWVFASWWQEVTTFGPFRGELPDHQWFWPVLGQHADPAKVANAQMTQLAAGTTHLTREYAKLGLDAETELQSAADMLGVTIDEYRALVRAAVFANGNLMPSNGGAPATPQPTEDVQPAA